MMISATPANGSTTTTSTSTTTSISTTTSTSSTTTTTTLPPEALEQVYELELQGADSVSELINPSGANGTATHFGGEINLFAETFGFEGPIAAWSSFRWNIPEAAWTLLGPRPQLVVVLDYGYSVMLSTGPNPGRDAVFNFTVTAWNEGAPLGEGTGLIVAIAAGDATNQQQSDTTGFGTPLPEEASGPIGILLEASCSVGPGSTIFQIGESSRCEAQFLPTIQVTLTRTEG